MRDAVPEWWACAQSGLSHPTTYDYDSIEVHELIQIE